MNDDMNNDLHRELKEHASLMARPKSVPPTARQLSETVHQRQRVRKLVRETVMAGVTVAACLLLVLRMSQPTEKPLENSIATTEPIGDGDLLEPNPIVPTLSPEQIEKKIRLLANVRQPVPVFEVDQESMNLRYIGWVEDEIQVPVDLEQIPSNERATFQRALYEPVRYDL